MFTIPWELPDSILPLSMEVDDRDHRRELTILAEHRAARSQLGPHFDKLSIVKSDKAGDPLVLGFTFSGSNRHGAGQDVEIFIRDLIAESRSPTSELQARRSAVLRPLSDFCKDDAAKQHMWMTTGRTTLKLLASRELLGAMFLRIDDQLTRSTPGVVVFAFSDYRFQDNGLLVDALASSLREGSN